MKSVVMSYTAVFLVSRLSLGLAINPNPNPVLKELVTYRRRFLFEVFTFLFGFIFIYIFGSRVVFHF